MKKRADNCYEKCINLFALIGGAVDDVAAINKSNGISHKEYEEGRQAHNKLADYNIETYQKIGKLEEQNTRRIAEAKVTGLFVVLIVPDYFRTFRV